MHDLKLERFYEPGEVVNDFVMLPDGPIKTFTLRGIKDSPPYLHDGRLMTLADTVEFFNLVLGTEAQRRRRRTRSSPTCWRSEPRQDPHAHRSPSRSVPPSGRGRRPDGQPRLHGTRHPDRLRGRARPDQSNNTDMLFVQLVGEGGLAEVDLGELAGEQGRRRCRQ